MCCFLALARFYSSHRRKRDLHKARGAGFLFFMALVAFLAGVFLLASLKNEARQRTALRLEQSGQLLHSWLERAHWYAQGEQQAIMADWAHTGNPGVTRLSEGELKASGTAPPWLKDTTEGDYLLGLIPDVQGIPLAFALYRNDRFDLNSTPPGFYERMAYRAAGQNGEAALIVGLTDPPAAEKTLIERALGSPLKQGDILVLADRHLDYNRDLLYRLPQPGQPELNRMETDLDLAGNSLSARSLSAGEATLGEARAENLSTQADLGLLGDLLAGRGTAGPLSLTTLDVTGSLMAAELNIGTLSSQTMTSESLRARALVLDDALVTPDLSAPEATAGTGAANRMTSFEIGRQGAGLPVTAGTLETGGLYSSDVRLSGPLTITGRCSGC